jgi:hypothetical protein
VNASTEWQGETLASEKAPRNRLAYVPNGLGGTCCLNIKTSTMTGGVFAQIYCRLSVLSKLHKEKLGMQQKNHCDEQMFLVY